jgi:hypothetical protein
MAIPSLRSSRVILSTENARTIIRESKGVARDWRTSSNAHCTRTRIDRNDVVVRRRSVTKGQATRQVEDFAAGEWREERGNNGVTRHTRGHADFTLFLAKTKQRREKKREKERKIWGQSN